MIKKGIFYLTVLFFIAGLAVAAEKEPASPQDETSVKTAPAPDAGAGETTAEEPEHGFGHKLLLYLPNRILDTFDFVRLRLRVGPGFAIGARATKPLSVFMGGYASVYAGLPGPRMKPTVKLPVGIESYSGVGVSMLDGTSQGKFGPEYSPTEIGVSIHPIIFGLDFDVDPVEVLDFALGFLLIDIRGDDL